MHEVKLNIDWSNSQKMDQRVMHVSKCVEDLLTMSYDIIISKEDEDSQQVNALTVYRILYA